MCGIAGFYKAIGLLEIRKETLRRMLTRIKHRGPDESGIYLNDQIGLGSVRLSIVDLSTGTMPLANENDTQWIVFNGEIFNYVELRAELENLGHHFETSSDTEVIVHMYDEYGPEFVNKLNGQFAIAIWDKQKEQLFLVRDRVGIRPLFYTELGDTFLFTSEIKALLEYPGIELQLSPKALSQYCTFWTSLSPLTAFEGIYELPPGCYMTIKNDKKEIVKYWELPMQKPGSYTYSNAEEAAEAFEEVFEDAIRVRLRADVPVAAYLSGGIDSSVTTAFIKQIVANNLQTFSIGFDEKDYDESSFQNIAATYFNTQHSSVSCSSYDIASHFEDVIWHAEAPLLRTAPTPMSLLAKSVRDHQIKVVITGEGADELLGGYNIFKETKIRHFWAKDPSSKYRPLLLTKLYPYLPQMKGAKSNVLKMFFGYKLAETKHPLYSHLLRWNNTSRIKNYLSDTYKNALKEYNSLSEVELAYNGKLEGHDFLTKAQRIELDIFMSGYLLSSQGDRMAMAHSVEGRYPFLDYRVVEFCMTLDPDLKLNGLNEKYLLKKMMKGRIPDPILNRPKQAYRAPIKSVFIADKTPAYVEEMLSEKTITKAGIFNPKHVKQLLEKMQTKKVVSEIDNMALTAILSTQLLYDKFVLRNIPALAEGDLISLNKCILDI
ncbi:asparagine synthase (glutamine-hydrolyzing) [Muriicola soli]|uniref:asparagine synthase (glutamine-hydrolyzing) n=1 Tax=Muriicola soli TaxID=2507538 RepID=A0A411E867_9FLAO|nr:asparagine synthase (glutamine-hydrolyzing) [Muriicola soli]QBA63879.1 asparagine synthase (glutamine-hydrolyzing) [Muriicola soli]